MKQKSLIEYYENELNFLDENGKELLEEFPHLFNYLDFSSNSTDPDIKQLIESVALLNAKLNKTICEYNDNQINSILFSFFPEFFKPIPSCVILTFIHQNINFNKKAIPAKTKVNLNNNSFVLNYSFETAFEVQLASFIIENVKIIAMIENNLSESVEAIQLDILNIGSFANDEVIIYLNASYLTALDIYQGINITSKTDKIPIFENSTQIGEISIYNHVDLFPYETTTDPAHKILIEANNYVNKFFFFKLKFTKQPKKHILIPFNSKKNIVLKKEFFILNCAPAINVTNSFANPIHVNNKNEKYHLTIQNLHQLYKIVEIKNQKNELLHNFFHKPYTTQISNNLTKWVLKKDNYYNKEINFIELIHNNFDNSILFTKIILLQKGAEHVAAFNIWNIENNQGNVVCYNINRPTKIKNFNIWTQDSMWKLINFLNDKFFEPNVNLVGKFKDYFDLFNMEDIFSNLFQHIHFIQLKVFLNNYYNYVVEKYYFVIKANLDETGVYFLCELIAKILIKQKKINTLIQIDLLNKNNAKVKEWKIE